MNTTRIGLAAFVIFAAGVLTGGVGSGLASRILRERPRREASPDSVVIRPAIPGPLIPLAALASNRVDGMPIKVPGNARLEAIARWTRELDLESAQRERIEVVLKAAQIRLRDLWGPVAPRVRGEIEAARLEIEGILNPNQRQRWDEARRRLGGANGADPVPENVHP